MTKVLIKYNSILAETFISIDEIPVGVESKLNVNGKRIQEWVGDLPKAISEECNQSQFDLSFMGSDLDFEDVQESVKQAEAEGIFIQLTHIPIEEFNNIEEKVERLFYKIQNGPIRALKSRDLMHSFESALNDEFEITVVATMSAGKSTLINALLQKKLMPSSQEACTATVTRIKDNDKPNFNARVLNNEDKEILKVKDIDLKKMEELNNDEAVSIIQLEGNIPFTSSENMSLVLIDTPGPNNSRDESHARATEKNLDESSKALVLYVLNATQLGVNDDKRLLEMISESMKVGGKQSNDRYLFVVNKLDQFRAGEDSVTESLERVKRYLAGFGIENPNLFPVSALSALDIRTLQNNPEQVNEDLQDQIELGIRKLNRNSDLHLENFATLTPSIRQSLEIQIEQEDTEDLNNANLALIHSGIPALEKTIRLYVEKYARPAKIKNVFDTFQKKVESEKSFEELKNKISKNTTEHEKIRDKIEKIEKKLSESEKINNLKEKIKALKTSDDLEATIEAVQIDIYEEIDRRFIGGANRKFTKEESDSFIDSAHKIITENIEIANRDIEKEVNGYLIKVANEILEEYKQIIQNLMGEVNDETVSSFEIEPITLILTEIDSISGKKEFLINQTETKEVKVGSDHVENPNKRGLLGFLKVWEPKHIVVERFETIEYISGEKIGEILIVEYKQIVSDITENLYQDIGFSMKRLKNFYLEEIDKLDQLLLDKLEDLKTFTSSSSDLRTAIVELEGNLDFLTEITEQLHEITLLKERK